jgi:hypothetical protein
MQIVAGDLRSRTHFNEFHRAPEFDNADGMSRFTCLTNGFSKKIANHAAAIALHYMHYNFCRIHKTLRVTPAMEAGLTDHVWSLEEVAALLDANAKSKKRGPYKKRSA